MWGFTLLQHSVVGRVNEVNHDLGNFTKCIPIPRALHEVGSS